MQAILEASDIVLIDFARALLRDAGLTAEVFDTNISLTEGMIGVFPRRLMVPADEAAQARRILREAGLERELRDA
ncbi:MAG: DUF2007 domain-containing protein [Rhodothalassiaceae bacterium]